MALTRAASGAYVDDFANASMALPVPAGVTSGALVCATLMVYGSSVTAPSISGFTAGPVSASALSAFGLSFKFFRFYKYASAADSGTYAVAKGASQVCAGYAWRVGGWTGSGSPFVDTLHEAANGSGSASVASFTPGGAGSLLDALWLADNTTAPTGFTLDTSATSRDGDKINLASLVQTTTAATGTLTFGSGEGVASVATIRQSAGGGAPIAASGTVSLAGAGVLGGGARGTGTVTLGGAAALGGRMAAAGTVTLGGQATLAAPGGALTASGQLLLGGGAALRAPIAAAGTVALGGQAALSTLSKMVASGVLALSGAASLRGALAGGGTIMLGGQAILFAGGSGDEMDEAEFWAQSSGLTPLRDYSTEEHQLAAMRAKLSLTGGSLDDVAPLYYGSLGYTGTVDEMEHAFWANLAGLSATAAYDSSQPDVKAQALATGPLVP